MNKDTTIKGFWWLPDKPEKAETAAELDAVLPAILDRTFKGEL